VLATLCPHTQETLVGKIKHSLGLDSHNSEGEVAQEHLKAAGEL
jgi:hypothetical protein